MRKILYTAKCVHIRNILSPFMLLVSFYVPIIPNTPSKFLRLLHLDFSNTLNRNPLSRKYFRFSHIDFQSLEGFVIDMFYSLTLLSFSGIAIIAIFATTTTTTTNSTAFLNAYNSMINMFIIWWFAAYLFFYHVAFTHLLGYCLLIPYLHVH